MSLEKELKEEAMARGTKAAVADARAHRTTAAIHARLVRLFDAGLAQKSVTHRKYSRDLVTKEIVDDQSISRSVLQEEVDEFSGYVHVLSNWIDELVRDGKMTIGEPKEVPSGSTQRQP